MAALPMPTVSMCASYAISFSPVPIVPITFLDHWKLFGDPGDLLSRGHPGFAHAVRHPYIDTKGMTEADLDDLRRRVHDAIEGPLKKYAPKKNGPPVVL